MVVPGPPPLGVLKKKERKKKMLTTKVFGHVAVKQPGFEWGWQVEKVMSRLLKVTCSFSSRNAGGGADRGRGLG